MQLFGFTHSLKRYHHYSSDCWIILILSDTNPLYCRGCLLVRQSFFHDDPSTWTDVGGGVLGCRGFHSSFRTTQSGLSLNIGKSSYTRSHMFGFTNDLIDSIISFPFRCFHYYDYTAWSCCGLFNCKPECERSFLT